jgi:hypothetical protein
VRGAQLLSTASSIRWLCSFTTQKSTPAVLRANEKTAAGSCEPVPSAAPDEHVESDWPPSDQLEWLCVEP